MMRMRYVGPLSPLYGLTAYVRVDENNPDMLLAQFDGKEDWRVPDEYKLKHPETGEILCYNWHSFPRVVFKPVIPIKEVD